MTRNEQVRFVKELTQSVTNEIVGDILNAKIPECWDGIELRQFLADRYAKAVFKGTLVGQRKRDYKNYVLIHNL